MAKCCTVNTIRRCNNDADNDLWGPNCDDDGGSATGDDGVRKLLCVDDDDGDEDDCDGSDCDHFCINNCRKSKRYFSICGSATRERYSRFLSYLKLKLSENWEKTF